MAEDIISPIIGGNESETTQTNPAENKKALIPAMLKCVNSAGYVTAAADILDENENKDQETINKRIVRFIPLVSIFSVTPEVEQSSLATHDDSFIYSYVWDSPNGRLLLRVDDNSQLIEDVTKYYMSWNDKPTGLASAQVDLKRDFFYTIEDVSLTIYHWVKPEGTYYGKLVPTGSGSAGNDVLVVNASHPRMNGTNQYVFDCDKTVNTVYDHINNGGIAIVKGSLAGSFQAILNGISLIDDVYIVSGITEINNTLYTLRITAPINSAQATLYAVKVLEKRLGNIESSINELENSVTDILYEISRLAGTAKFIPLQEILTVSPAISSNTLETKKEGYTYSYVWSTTRKKLYIQEVRTNSSSPSVPTYYAAWNDAITGVASEAIDATKDFFYTLDSNYLTIWHWSGDSSTGKLVPTGTDLTEIRNTLSNITNTIGVLPSGTNSIGEFITNIVARVTALEEESGHGGGGSDITVDEELDSQSTNPVENRAIKLAINHLQGQIDQLDPEGEVDDYDYTSDPAYPEHYGAKGDGIPYYDWPLACFNGFESDEVAIESVASDIEVFEPAERIMNKYGLTVNHKGKSMAYCSDSVVYNEPTQKFLLKISNGTEYVYYDKWVNSDVWNSGATGKARTDTVFSDIHELPVSEKQSYGLFEDDSIQTITYSDSGDAYAVAARKSYIFDANAEEPTLKELYKTMTDDGAALAAWFDANNGGTMKLRPGAIYYFRHIGDKAISHKPANVTQFNVYDENHNIIQKNTSDVIENIIFKVNSNTIILGNNATLFPHRIDPGWPCKRSGTHERRGGHVTIFELKNQTSVENIHFYDFSVNTLRDKDGNGPAGDNNARFSTSQSSITVFASDNGITVSQTIIPYAVPNNIYIDKVNAKNVTSYFSSGSTVGNDANMLHDIYISNAIVIGLLGSIVSLRDSVYDNVYMETAPYPGHEGSHLFYFDANNNNLTIKNSKLISPDPYREAFITFHAVDGRAGTHNLYYENCVIEATGPIFSTTHVTANCNIIVHFKNSTISKTFDTSCGDNVMSNAYYVLSTQYKGWEFVNSVINVRTGVVSNSGDYKLILKDTTVNSDLTVPVHKSLFGWDSDNVYSSGIYAGPVEVSNFKTNYLGPLGFNLPVDTHLSDAEQQLLMIKRLMLGTDADVQFGTTPPVNPAVGDLYFDITTSTLYRCTAIGLPSYVAIKINKSLTGAPYTSTQTITLNSNEIIPITFKGDETSATTLEGRFARILLDAGYKQGNITSVFTNRTPGQFYFADSNTLYLFITSKGQTTVDIDNCIDVYGSSYPIIDKAKSLRDVPNYLYSAQGTPPTWQEVSGISGIIGEIQGLDYRVEQLEG